MQVVLFYIQRQHPQDVGLQPIIGGSWHKYDFYRDKCLVTTNICRDKHIFVATKGLLRQAYFCRDKHVFIGKHTFVATKHVFVATKLLSRQKWYLWQSPPMITAQTCVPCRLLARINAWQVFPALESSVQFHTPLYGGMFIFLSKLNRYKNQRSGSLLDITNYYHMLCYKTTIWCLSV